MTKIKGMFTTPYDFNNDNPYHRADYKRHRHEKLKDSEKYTGYLLCDRTSWYSVGQDQSKEVKSNI